MSVYQCPQYSGSGAGTGRATCQFFASMDAHPDVKWAGITVALAVVFFCLHCLKTGKAF
jgi:hypothetical protein